MAWAAMTWTRMSTSAMPTSSTTAPVSEPADLIRCRFWAAPGTPKSSSKVTYPKLLKFVRAPYPVAARSRLSTGPSALSLDLLDNEVASVEAVQAIEIWTTLASQALYLEAAWKPTNWLTLIPGIRGAYRDLDPSERCQVALKRLTVSAQTPSANPNVNPTLAPLLVNGEPVDASALVPVDLASVDVDDLEVILSVAALPESVDELDGDEPPDEVRLPVAWYTTCGSLNADTDDLVCQPPLPGDTTPTCEPVQTTWKPTSSGECTVHVTLRDNRGGVHWLTQRFVVGS